MKILLVEDEKHIATFIKKGLEGEFYTVDVARDGREGLLMATTKEYDLLILDIILPEMDGIGICRKVRATGIKTPVLLLSAMDAVKDKVEGLESGADDYLTKPFAFSELLARIKALLRRMPEAIHDLTLEDLRLDLLSRRVFRGEQEIILTPREFSLLEYLVKNKGRVLSRAQIIETIWGYHVDPTSNTVDVHIKFLREKVDKGFAKRLIQTVRGEGYVAKAPDD
jgi:two-component system OmpR family response regulator